MTLEKYFDKLQVIEKSTGLKEVVKTDKILCGESKPKIACLWPSDCEFKKEGYCTNPKYCNRKKLEAS